MNDSYARLLDRLRTLVRCRLGLPPPLVQQQLLGRSFLVRAGTIRAHPDYDDAWMLALALRAEVVFDVGANVGYDCLLASFSASVRHITLIEANPEALAIAAENLIRNRLSADTRLVPAFASDQEDASVRLWTIGAGAAGSMFVSHAGSAFRARRSIEVPTVTVDSLCARYGTVPDLVKIDVEGAEHWVLAGSRECARGGETRFLVEMHRNADLSMAENARRVLNWCAETGCRAWYLASGEVLEDAVPIKQRGRCHLLLQPGVWPYPEWLRRLRQGAPLQAALEQPASPGVA